MAKQRRTTPPPTPKANANGVVRPQGGPHPGHSTDACSVCAVALTEAYLRGQRAAEGEA